MRTTTLNTETRSSTMAGSVSASWAACARSVGLRLETDIEGLRERERARVEQPAAGPPVLVGDRQAQEVAAPVADVAAGRRPADGADDRAVPPVAVGRDVGIGDQRAVGLLDHVEDVDLGHGDQPVLTKGAGTDG